MVHAIVVVDVQKDFVEGGSLAVEGGQKLATQLSEQVLPVIREKLPNTVIVFTKDWHIDPGTHFSDNPDYVDSWPRHCVAETEGAEFAADFDAPKDHIFRKGMYAASYSGADGVNIDGENLIDFLHSVEAERVDVIGIAFDYCVAATATDLAAAGFDTHVIKYFTASVHPENDMNVVTTLEKRGAEVYITPTMGATFA